MHQEEIWAVPLDRITGFFLRQAETVPAGDWLYWKDCIVILQTLPPRPMGPWPIPQTRVIIHGPDEQAKELYRRFFLTFVSAGG